MLNIEYLVQDYVMLVLVDNVFLKSGHEFMYHQVGWVSCVKYILILQTEKSDVRFVM